MESRDTVHSEELSNERQQDPKSTPWTQLTIAQRVCRRKDVRLKDEETERRERLGLGTSAVSSNDYLRSSTSNKPPKIDHSESVFNMLALVDKFYAVHDMRDAEYEGVAMVKEPFPVAYPGEDCSDVYTMEELFHLQRSPSRDMNAVR
eukprot:GILK01002634.1.p1 GENE.GILK01002634.1~~GILK01002634.1.p1  ORF type:complete len:148 (-),score=18.33 GILK01002634.1:144-587(-)